MPQKSCQCYLIRYLAIQDTIVFYFAPCVRQLHCYIYELDKKFTFEATETRLPNNIPLGRKVYKWTNCTLGFPLIC